jgi:hypothetical protein
MTHSLQCVLICAGIQFQPYKCLIISPKKAYQRRSAPKKNLCMYYGTIIDVVLRVHVVQGLGFVVR